jgi:hypothetical protein
MSNNPQTSNSYSKQNDYQLLKLEIMSNRGGQPIDLTPQFVELMIFENVFDTKMIGEVTILDVLNYSEFIPIVGNETIFIQFKTPGADKPIDIVGKVFTVLGKSRRSNEKSETYKFQFVSEVQYENMQRKICCSKKGTMSKIVSDIFTENFKDMNPISIDETNNKAFQFLFPYWSPLYCINWLAQRTFSPGQPNNNTPSCFFFYEDVDGFHFVDLVRRSVRQPVITYRYEPPNPLNSTDVNRYFERVQDYQVDSFFDRMTEYQRGMYSGYLMTHDITKKKMNYFEYDYHDSFDKINHLNEYKLIPSRDKSLTDSKMGFMNYLPVQSGRHDSVKENDFPQNYLPDRASIIRQFSTMRMTLLVNGNSTLRLLDVVNFEIPKTAYMDGSEKDWEDQHLSGNYIVVSLKHMINREVGYNTSIGMAKDSLIKGIPDSYE